MKKIIKQFSIFCGVGVINTAIGLGIILFLSEILHVQYMIANAAGYGAGLCVSFALNRLLTFRATDGRTSRQVPLFLAVFALSYGAQLAVLAFLVDGLGLYNAPSQIAACAVYTILNFAGNRFVTFSEKAP